MIEIKLGDLSQLDFSVDAIVNAANQALIPGGGVDGVLNRAAGPELKQAMAKIGGTPPGTAVITPAFKLPAKYVIHAVGPRYQDGQLQEQQVLTKAYEAIFQLAHAYDVRTIAMPVLSADIYGYPKEEAAKILLSVADRPENQTITTTIIIFEAAWFAVFAKVQAELT